MPNFAIMSPRRCGLASSLLGATVLFSVQATQAAAQAVPQAVAPSHVAPAQPAPDAPQLSEVVVTANRREQSLQRVDLSVASETGRQMDQLNIRRPEDLTRLVPGLTSIPNAGSAVTSYAVRGVGESDFTEHQEQPVAVYQDGVYISLSSATGFPIFDVQRAEVLRGPQGTLFGRNATGGLVQFYSNAPKSGFSGGISGGVGDYDTHRVEGYVNDGNDAIAGRLALYHSDSGGYIKNDNGPDLLSSNVNGLRAQVLYRPDNATRITLRVEGFETSGTSFAGKDFPTQIINGYGVPIPGNVDVYGKGPGTDIYGFRDKSDPYTVSVTDPGAIDKHSGTIALYGTREIGPLTLSSTSAYTRSSVYYREDSDGTLRDIQRYQDGGASDTFSEELRLQKNAGRFRWNAGLYLLSIDGSYFTLANFPHLCDITVTTTCSFTNNGSEDFDLVNGKGASPSTRYSLRTRSAAVFAQGEYDITDKLTLTIGGRDTYDDQKFVYNFACSETIANACNVLFGTPTGDANVGPEVERQHYDNWSGKAALDYKLTSSVLLYASYNRGIKSSSYFADTVGDTPADKLAIKPEKLTDYEAGAKSQFLDHRLTVNADVFKYVYQDFQTFSFNGDSTSVVNLPAFATGGELEVTGLPGYGVVVNGGFAYDNFFVRDVSTPSGTITQRPINAPPWQANWGVSKKVELTDDLSFVLSYNGRYTGDRYFNIVNSPDVFGPSFVLHNLNITFQKGDVSVSAYCNNCTNKTYSLINFDQSFEGFYVQHIGEPRTVGVSASYNF